MSNSLIQYIASVAAFERQSNRETPIAGMCDFILREGQIWTQGGPCKLKQRKAGECFSNAASVALRAPQKYRYVEGYGFKPNLIPIHHAWLVTTDGIVVDNTWDHEEGTLYFGVAFDHEFLYRALVEKGTYGLLSDGCLLMDLTLGLHKTYRYKPMESRL